METAQTADYALRALLVLERKKIASVAALAAELSISRTVAQRVLATLHDRAFVTRDVYGRYRLGPALLSISRTLPHELAVIARPLMRTLSARVRETIILAVQDSQEAVVVAAEAGNRGTLRVEYEVGFRQPMHRGASGLVILAHAASVGTAQSVRKIDGATLARVREQGYARTEGQVREGMVGYAVPIFTPTHAVLGSLGVVVPAARADSASGIVPELQATAELIAEAHANAIGEAQMGQM